MNTFGCRRIDVGVEQRQQLHAAVAAARGDERRDRRIGPGLHQIAARAAPRRRRVVVAREHALVVDRLEAELPQLGDAGVELVARERAGGRDDGDAVAGAQRARLTHDANRAISAATA